MMLTVHGLPPNTKYYHIKALIKEKCNITDFILDTLGVDGDKTKKVRVGVACDSDGAIIMKYLDGYRFNEHVLRIVPIGKPANNMSQVNTSNESNYQWRNNEQPAQFNYDNSMPPVQNQPGAWPLTPRVQQSNTQWTNNQIIPQQIPSQNNFGYVQPVLAAQQPFYHEGRRMQETFSSNVPVIEFVPLTPQPPRGNPPRPNVLTNVMVTDQQLNRQPVQGGRYTNQGYPDKSQTIMKDHFQGPSYMGPQTILPNKGHYQGQEWPEQGRQEKIERFQKHPTQFENPDNKIIQPDKRQVTLHNEERNTDGNQYEKGLRRFSPTRDHRLTPDDHKMLPSGRRMSPAPRNSQFKNRISPIGRNVPSDRRISPSGRQIPEPGRRMSPPGRQFSPSGRQLPQSERQNVQPGRRISPSGRRFSPPRRQISSPGRHLQTGRAISPPGRRMSPPARRVSPSGRRISPIGGRFSPPGRRISPPGRRISPPGRRISPPGRRISPSGPSGRPITPSGRRISPSRRQFSPPGRRISPSGPSGRPMTPSGRRISPSRRQFSPTGRIISPSRRRITPDRSFLPSGRRVSPGRGISPGGRRMSPVHRPSPAERRVSPGHRMAPMNKGPQGDRHMVPSSSPSEALNRKISPSRHVSPNRGPPRTYNRYSPPRKSGDNLRPGSSKDVGPSYAISQAQNQAMYSGYLPDSRDIEQYPPASSRKIDHRPIWQEREKPYQQLAKSVDDRRDGMQKYDSRRVGDYSRANQPENKILSPSRTSRSPNRRDRSPVRDRYRRHSPSPRSPRRSWALEKRRSPDNIEAPPPPCWPERHDSVYIKQNRQNDERSSKKPVWEKPETGQKPEGNSTFFRKEDRRSYDSDDRKYFQSSTRTQWEPRQPKEREEFRERSPHRSRPSERYTHNKNESNLPREHYDNKPRNEFQRQYSRNQEPHKDRYEARNRNDDDFDGFRHKKDDIHQSYDDREELYMGRENLDRKIEDVYKRAEELTRKSEEYQRKRSEKTRFSADRNRRTGDDSFINRSGGSSRQDFYESSKSRFDENPRDVDEIRNIDLAAKVQYKRDKAVHEITSKTLMKFAPDLTGKRREEVEELLKITIEDMIFEMFGEKDVSFIEVVIKFEERYGNEDMEKIFDNVMSKFPIQVRVMKRSARDVSSSSAKIPRSSSRGSTRDMEIAAESNDWDISKMVVSHNEDKPVPVMATILVVPPMIMAPSNKSLKTPGNGYVLYLCKDNFEPYNEYQAHYLKDFIVKNIVDASERSNGWTPDLTLRGVQNDIQYVVWTRDKLSDDWLLSLDFSKFEYFNVIIYTTHDFRKERGAIWLPGHPKTRTIPALEKLKMQNRHLDNVNIHTWNLVKEVIIEKGTRLYVDMPPSSARALEKHNMTLSYELQKVQVFLKAVAIDKKAFDAGLEEPSLLITSNLYQKNAPMPAIDSDAPNVVKLGLDYTPVSVSTARKIKEQLILQIYKYIKEGGKSRTDFLKYGYCKPGYLCVIPGDADTAKWVKSTSMHKINSHTITVCETDKVSVKYITMTCQLPYDKNMTPKKVLEKLKKCNRSEKGLKFNLWKNGHVFPTKNNTKMAYRTDVDLESVEALIKLKFLLEYYLDNRIEPVNMRCHHTVHKLREMIQKFKDETTDTLNVVNMDISSEEDDVVCID